MRGGAFPAWLASTEPTFLHALGDDILAGLDARELVDAIEDEIRDTAAELGVPVTPAMLTGQAWELLQSNIDDSRRELRDIREALEATGSLSPGDRSTPLADLITALFEA